MMSPVPRYRSLLPWLPYPVIFAGVFALFGWFQALGLPLVVSTYLPVLGAAAAVTFLEAKLPHRLEWRPSGDELRTDLTFMTIVQLATPPLVGFFFAYALL